MTLLLGWHEGRGRSAAKHCEKSYCCHVSVRRLMACFNFGFRRLGGYLFSIVWMYVSDVKRSKADFNAEAQNLDV